MRRITTKITAVLLAVLMLLPFFAAPAFAALGDGEQNSLRIETAIYKKVGGVWTRTTRVNPGDSVKARIFVKTDYFSNGADLTVFYDNDFFTDGYNREVAIRIPCNTDNSVISSYIDVDGSQFYQMNKERITQTTGPELLRRGVLSQEFYDTHNYFQLSIMPKPATKNFIYDSDDWMFEFALEVRVDATGTGDFFVAPETICSKQQQSARGINFPKGQENDHESSAMPNWYQNESGEFQVELVSNPVGVPGAAMNVEIDIPEGDDNVINVGETKSLTCTVGPEDTLNTQVIWSSSDEAVASVENGVITGIGPGKATVTVTTADGGFTDTYEINVFQPLTGMSTYTKIGITGVGETTTIRVTFQPSNASNKAVTWTSDNPAVATVDRDTGVITSVSGGTANITVTAEDGGFTATCVVTVKIPATGIDITEAAATVSVGETVSLTAAVTPSDATNNNIIWSSSDESIATVSGGVVTGVSKGTATVTACSEDGSFTDTCLVTVIKPAAGIEVTPSTANVIIGETVSLTAAVAPSDATNNNIIWSSSDESIATVSGGVVTGVSKGTVTVTACSEDGGFTATCVVTVKIPATGIDITEAAATVSVGETVSLTAAVTPSDATNNNIIWSSSDESIATVSGGVVTGVSKGTATVTACSEDGSFTDTCLVTVIKPVSSIEFSGDITAALKLGETTTLSVNVQPADASSIELIWQSSDSGIAEVSADGTVRAVAPGTAVITVRTADGSFETSVSITVSNPMESITLSQTEATMKYKKTSLRLTATPVPGDAQDSEIIWSTSDPSIVRVDQNGNVTARDMGTAFIIASNADGTVSQKCRVTVTMNFFQRIVRFFKIIFGVWNKD